ncbi:glucose/quinate/shikimate family membrane-bound PQQ-dependent dehydrogenase [Roseomonas marmotae]|uniref:Glucose/quinate/shikimate family membrane-bound PQQ-dependent dehydrogenase n=1 Tax=Roseomonas marmotae TaxID=2768161 RepID=A0ABS3KC19_9PROT|nr:glucose/quinate/shikimate family membrane-bound PQQ-dependent dehydrogenase [Roseomonas marmotae]MBO1074997.1 glucose/quinate/shikimate family membrane-bound PQQ-dependent dehydrogenase [Roseomonas marmotae]QTI79967.1 glucose/quinate/shikimate family membrane-bound PQQ-dependent dehydrogenase [Roseomonas marmotae]
MQAIRRSRVLAVLAIILVLLGLALAIGGGWLVALQGSWYYFCAGLAMLVTAWLLWRRSPAALWVYALLTAATLLWAIWESGLSWWPLTARGDLIFLLGLVLLTPWVTRGLGDPASPRRVTAFRGGGLALSVVLLASVVAAGMALTNDPGRIDGRLPGPRTTNVAEEAIPEGEWHAYGRTGHGQRYSPLAQITPENISRLEVAWTYNTGDQRGRPGDPEETTFQVTPLKIGDRLFLCTPHQNVIALDADTGQEVWRYSPRIQNELALQHLTCRGLSYHEASGDAPAPAAAPSGTPQAPGGAQVDAAPQQAAPPLRLPAAADGARTVADCPRRLFMPTADGRLIALDPESGGVCTSFGDGGQINLWTNMPNVKPGGYYSTSPVVVTRNLVIVGGTVLDNVSTNETSGVIRAFDVNTGALVWNWDSGNPEQTAPLPPGQTYTPNSPNSWSISAVDEDLGMVYVPLGNQPPDQWGADRSEEVERFSSSVVALDLATGQVRWVFQTVHHDLWDYDVPSQPSLIDLTLDGQRVPALVQPTKQGEIYVLNRETGQPVLPVTETPVPQGAVEGDRTAPTQPVSRLSYEPPPLTEADMWGATLLDQMACRIALKRLRYEGRYTPPSLQGTLVYPGNFGVFNWGSVAVDPRREVAFTTPTYLAFVSRLVPRPDATSLMVQGGERPEGSLPALNENFGAPYAVQLYPFTSVLGLPCQQPPWGYVAGADLRTGEILWRRKNGTTRDAAPVPLPFPMGVPNLGGPIMTAGGVAFLSGTIDNYVRGYDVTDGRELWRARLPAGGQATPMTYAGRDGRQYLLVVAGGHGSLGTKAGDAVIAYALPSGG